MAAGDGGGPGNGGGNDRGNGEPYAGDPEILRISENQAAYIQEHFPDAAIYPTRQRGEEHPPPVEFLYRQGHLLTRDRDLDAVLAVLNRSERRRGGDQERATRPRAVTHPIPGLVLVEVFPSDDRDEHHNPEDAAFLFDVLDTIERELGPGKALPDHLMSVTDGGGAATHCPATEPIPVPAGTGPQPGVSRSRCDGRGALVAVVDTGLLEGAVLSHPWMHGVQGETDPIHGPGGTSGFIWRYGGHGTFIASIVRAMAPRAEVLVKRIFQKAGAVYESEMVRALLPVLDWAPDVISLSAGTHTWKNHGLLSFHVFVDGPLREREDTVLVAAAGNDGEDWKFSPAEMKGVLSVGALGPPGDARAWFSNYGDWVDVYAPGQDLVHAYADGVYQYQETNPGTTATFHGMAKWSGTSFSTPVVSGLIAARMSGSGQSARDASESLLRLARAQALPGVGPVLRPGQACLNACGQECQGRPERCGCGGHRPRC
jgi:hypothetical protein